MHLAARAIKFGGGTPARRLLVAGAQTTPLVSPVTKFGSGLPAGRLLADGDTDNVVWRLSPSSLAAGSLLGC